MFNRLIVYNLKNWNRYSYFWYALCWRF